jgi:hypothetical protein
MTEKLNFHILQQTNSDNNKIQVLENISVSPNELSSLNYIDEMLYSPQTMTPGLSI